MVFLIQNTQNRDSKAIHLKIDELIRSSSARNSFLDLEDTTDDELAMLDREFHDLSQKQQTSDALHKLHSKLQIEHKRRHEHAAKITIPKTESTARH